jgi:uncharacterized membrane protein YccC
VNAPLARLGAFVRTELEPDPGRVRAFLRLEVGLLLASFIAVTFKPANAYWIVIYLLLVSTPSVGNSLRNAIGRIYTSVVGCALAFALIIVAYDQPWIYTPLQALLTAGALFIARSTPIGPVALTGGATFAIISASDVMQLPSNLISLGFYRVLQAIIGGALGALVQLCFWFDDPLDLLRRSLRAQLASVEAVLHGETALLDEGRVARHVELLNNALYRHPSLVCRRSELAALVLDVGCAVDEALRQPLDGEAVARARRRLAASELFAPAAAPPPPPPPRLWHELLREAQRPAGRTTLKMAMSAFIAVVITQLLGYPSGGALFTALAVSMQVSSGTAVSKPLLVVAGLVLALVVMLLVITPAMPNVEDPGSFLVLAAIAFAPTAWLFVAGERVRTGGLFGTAVVAFVLFNDFRPAVDLEQPARFALTIAIGALVVAVVDRVVWPVDSRRGMWRRASAMLRETAALYRERDPCVVLAPNLGARWRQHRDLVALVQLRSERVPLPGSFAPEEEALRVAAWAQRLLVERIEEARRELAGIGAGDAEAARAHIAADLEARAAEIERDAQLR